jgi:exopolysaccharide production protein ExoQ
MTPLLAAAATCLFIGALFCLDRDNTRMSKTIWIPTIWLLIASSRPFSEWFGQSPGSDTIEGSPLDRNILTVLLIGGLVVILKRRPKVFRILRSNRPILMFFAFCGISMLWSDFPFVVFKRWCRSLGDVVMILIIITEPNWADALKRVLMRIGLVLIPLSILFIRFFPQLGRRYTVGGAMQWTGVGTDKNALGMLCMVFGVSLLWRGITTYTHRNGPFRTRQLMTIGILSAMNVYLVIIGDSQTSLSCFLMSASMVAMTALNKTLRKPLVVSLVLATMLTVSFSVLFLGIGGDSLSAIGRNATLTGRTEIWKTVLPYAVNPWVGTGYEGFWMGNRTDAFKRLGLAGLNQAHNGYIEIYLNLGWTGLVLLGIVIVSGYRNIMKGLRKANTEMTRLRIAFFLICLAYNFTEATFKMMSPVWIMFLWSAMAVPNMEAESTVTVRKRASSLRPQSLQPIIADCKS